MSGYNLIVKIERLKEKADELGFMFCYPKYRNNTDVDQVGIKPKDDNALPIYCRDAELYHGSINDIEAFFHGIEWARNYDRMLKVSDDKKRERKEQDERNRQLMQRLKEEKLNLVNT